MPHRVVLIAVVSVLILGCSGTESTQTTTTTTGTPGTTVEQVVAAVEPSGVSAPTLTVVGSGVAYGVPDILTADMVVSVIRETATEAGQIAADVSRNVINALTKKGVTGENIRSSDYSLYQEYDYQYDARRFLGFRVRHTYSVKLDLANAGDVIDAAVAASWDALEIQGTYLSLEDSSPLISEARADAWSDCLATAQEMAALAGLTLGDPVTVTEGYTYTQPGPYLGAGGDGEGSTTFQPGRISAVAELTVEFATSR
jgi:hypothetical protein